MSDWARCNHLAHNEEDSYRLLSRLHTHTHRLSPFYTYKFPLSYLLLMPSFYKDGHEQYTA